MDGEMQEAQGAQAAEPQAQGQVLEGGQGSQDVPKEGNDDAAKDYEAAIAERDRQIQELQARVAEAAKSEESAAELTRQIDALKEQAESDRVEYELKLAGCRSVRAGKALLEEHGGDVDAMKAANPWLFGPKADAEGGKTGLEPKGAASGADGLMRRWRKLAGLEEE